MEVLWLLKTVYRFGTFGYILRLDYCYLPFTCVFSFSSPIILFATSLWAWIASADSCSFAFKVLEDAVKGEKRAIALYQGFMDNIALFDSPILPAVGKTASIKKPSGMSITHFSIYSSLACLWVVDLYCWSAVPQKIRQCSWLCKNLSRLLELLSWGRMQE